MKHLQAVRETLGINEEPQKSMFVEGGLAGAAVQVQYLHDYDPENPILSFWMDESPSAKSHAIINAADRKRYSRLAKSLVLQRETFANKALCHGHA